MYRFKILIPLAFIMGFTAGSTCFSTGGKIAAAADISTNPFEGFPEFVEKKMKEWKVPGLAIGVVKNNRTLFLKGFGYRDVEKGLRVTPQTLFGIGSVSKPFTALSLGMLIDADKLGWDTPVIEYLKDFRLYDAYSTLHTTPRDLLCHRTGLPGHYMMIRAANFSREQIFARLRHLEPSAGFRERYQYNNLMYITAGYLVGRITGATWENFVTERIFKPLGMRRSCFTVSALHKSDNFALPYEEKDGRVKAISFRDFSTSAPAGGIKSCAEDMIAWLRLYIKKGTIGKEEIVSEDSLNEMFAPQIPIRYTPESLLGPTEAYGLGWTIRPYRGHYLVHHGGWIDGFVTWVSIMPEEKIGIVVLSNKGNQILPNYLNYHIYHRLLELDRDWTIRVSPEGGETEKKQNTEPDVSAEAAPPSKPTHTLGEFAGLYEHAAYGQIEVKAEAEKLKAIFNRDTVVPLTHYQYNIFISKHEIEEFNNLRFCFPVSMAGTIESLQIPLQPEVNGYGIGDILFTRVADKSLRSRKHLLKFAGTFTYQGIVVKIKVLGKGKLVAHVPGEGAYEMEPFTDSVFKLKGTDWKHARIEFKKFDTEGNGTEAIVYLKEGSFPVHRKK